MKKSSWFIFFLILAVSCLDDPDCFRLNNNVVGFAFKVIGSSRPDTVRLSQITVSGTQNFVPDTVTSSVYVPVNFTTTTSQVTFWFTDGTTKFLDLDYLLKTQFISEDCGSRYELSNLTVREGSDIDSVRVISGEPGKSTGAINVEIMRCPDPRYVGVAFFDMVSAPTADLGYTVRTGSLAVDSITTSNGTVLYRQVGRPIFYLPVDPTAQETTFNFYTRGGDPTAPQRLRLTYTTAPRNSFPALCPEIQFVDDLRIAGVDESLAATDTLGIDENNRFLDYSTDPPSTNVRLFRCPQTNLASVSFRKRTSATGSQTRGDTIAVKRITSDYAPGRVYYANRDLSSAILPVNTNRDTTIFYIEYADANIPTDTVQVRYTSTETNTSVPMCTVMTTYSDLAEVGDPNNTNAVTVAPTGTAETSTLRNPPNPNSPNIQIIHAFNQ